MHCGKIISVAISFLKNASLPGLLRDNRMKSYYDKELIWASEFESLGITFKVKEMKDIIEMNMESLLENVKELGGLELTNILLFDKALTLSRLRRICNQEEGWASFPRCYYI